MSAAPVEIEALSEIQALRERRGRDRLRQQLLWRIRRLNGRVDLGVPEYEDAFREIFEGFEPSDDARLILVPSQFLCEATCDYGGTIAFGGILEIASNPVAVIQRRIFLRQRFVFHEYLYVLPPYRDYGIAVAVLKHSFSFFDELGMRYVVVLAALESGRWYWARCGYTFLRPSDRQVVEQWTQRALAALDVDVDTSGMTEPSQFLEVGAPRTIAIDDLIAAFPGEAQRFAEAARANNVATGDQIPLGKAILICGPEWWGRLDLRGPSRAAFDVYARSRLAEVARRLGLSP